MINIPYPLNWFLVFILLMREKHNPKNDNKLSIKCQAGSNKILLDAAHSSCILRNEYQQTEYTY